MPVALDGHVGAVLHLAREMGMGVGVDTCKLCRFIAGGPSVPGEVQPVALASDENWIAALNENQATLGRVYFVLKRHEEDITQLSAAERESLFRQTAAVKTALTTLFAPDHFNYMFHMNLVRHAHFHIYPRYASPRRFAGQDFADTRYGGHYDPAADLRLDDPTRDAIVTALRQAM